MICWRRQGRPKKKSVVIYSLVSMTPHVQPIRRRLSPWLAPLSHRRSALLSPNPNSISIDISQATFLGSQIEGSPWPRRRRRRRWPCWTASPRTRTMGKMQRTICSLLSPMVPRTRLELVCASRLRLDLSMVIKFQFELKQQQEFKNKKSILYLVLRTSSVR